MILDRRQYFLFGAALCSTAVLSPFATMTASAHRLKKATTRVIWQDSDHSLEVTHILHLHDAELALSARGLLDRPDLTSLKARAQLSLYVEDHFNVTDITGTQIPLEAIGAEIQNGQIYVYQEANLKEAPKGLIVDNSILLDIFGAQVNMVNVNLAGAIKTLQFEQGDRPKKVLA